MHAGKTKIFELVFTTVGMLVDQSVLTLSALTSSTTSKMNAGKPRTFWVFPSADLTLTNFGWLHAIGCLCFGIAEMIFKFEINFCDYSN